MPQTFVLTPSCPQRPGIVHAVTAFLFGHGCDIVELSDDRPQRVLGMVSKMGEAVALARAVKWHSERRVLRGGHGTVVFR